MQLKVRWLHIPTFLLMFLGCESFLRCHAMNCCCECSNHDINYQLLPILPKSNLARFCFSINLNHWRLTWPTRFCQIPMSLAPFPCVNNMEFNLSVFTSKMNIRPFLFPFVINLPQFFMSSTKHPLGLNVTRKPCFTIWPTETIFFVMVGT